MVGRWMLLALIAFGTACAGPRGTAPVVGTALDWRGQPVQRAKVSVRRVGLFGRATGPECFTLTNERGAFHCEELGDEPFFERRRYRATVSRAPLFEDRVIDFRYDRSLEPLEVQMPPRYEPVDPGADERPRPWGQSGEIPRP